MNIYVGNLPFNTGEEDLRQIFAAYGQVNSAAIIKDKMTGRSRGFGFVEMTNDAEAKEAIAGLNGTEMEGRTLTVNEARPRTEGGGGGRRPGGGGSRGGGAVMVAAAAAAVVAMAAAEAVVAVVAAVAVAAAAVAVVAAAARTGKPSSPFSFSLSIEYRAKTEPLGGLRFFF